MPKQFLNRIEIPPQFLLVGNELVNRRMAIATQVNGLSHLLAIKSLAKPFVGMAFSRNQMMRRRSLFGDSPAEFAGYRNRLRCSHLDF